jgi:predicted nucleic acid-binding protein
MYLVGADHPNKVASLKVLGRLIQDRQRLVTDAEVFQEILHRYTAINRTASIQPAFDVLTSLVDEVFPLNLAVAEAAKNLVLMYPETSARDAIHVATMEMNGISRILTFDKGFRLYHGIQVLATDPV